MRALLRILREEVSRYLTNVLHLEWEFDWISRSMRRRSGGVWSFPAKWEYRPATEREFQEAVKYWGDTATW